MSFALATKRGANAAESNCGWSCGTEVCTTNPATFAPPSDASVWATVGMTTPAQGDDVATGNSSSTDTSAKSVAIASELTSTQAIKVQVGNSASFEGANLTAQQIAFVNTDPTKTGKLILNGSTNTTQTSHAEKSETLGVYQEAKGQGSTIQTLNQTTLKGNVSFDAGLKITAQVPKEVQVFEPLRNCPRAPIRTAPSAGPKVQYRQRLQAFFAGAMERR